MTGSDRWENISVCDAVPETSPEGRLTIGIEAKPPSLGGTAPGSSSCWIPCFSWIHFSMAMPTAPGLEHAAVQS